MSAAQQALDDRARASIAEDLADKLTRVRDDLSGLAMLAAGLADLGRDSIIEAGAVSALGDLARKSRDKLTRAIESAEVLK